MNKMGAMNAEEMKNYKGVFVFAQQVDNKLSGISFELIGEGKRLAEKLDEQVTAVLIGSDVKGLVDELAEYGADRVIVVDDPELKEYRTEPYAHALASVINEYKPEIVLVGATAIGRDLGPTVSARVATGLTADCTLLEIGDFPLVALPNQEQKHNQLLMTRPAFGGNTIATIACPDNRPQMATVRPGVMQKLDKVAGKKAEVIEYNPGFVPNNKYVEILEISKAISDIKDIMDAKILVSGGRGVGSAENFKLLDDLVINLEEWSKDTEYDRLGLEDNYMEFLGNKVVSHNIPIRPGRNIAIIVESAAVNHRQKKMGYNAAQELYNRVTQNIMKGNGGGDKQ